MTTPVAPEARDTSSLQTVLERAIDRQHDLTVCAFLNSIGALSQAVQQADPTNPNAGSQTTAAIRDMLGMAVKKSFEAGIEFQKTHGAEAIQQ